MRGDVGRSAIIIWTARTCEAAAEELVVELRLVESIGLRLLDRVELLLQLRDPVHAQRAVQFDLRKLALDLLHVGRLARPQPAAAAAAAAAAALGRGLE